MLDEQTQSTDVSPSPPAGEASTSEATAPSVSPSGDGQATAPGGDTAQLDTTGQTDSEAGTVDPTQDDPLKDVPSLEELEQNKSQQYAQALINLRTAYEARKEELSTLQQQLEPLKGLPELGEPEVVKSIVETYQGLFTPVVNPETQQPVTDQFGNQQITTLPFIERVDSENPGMAEQLLVDLLRHAPEGPEGKVPLWQQTLKAWGLDPNRLDDYRNIDALVAPSTGEVTPDELGSNGIPQERAEAYKTLPASLRNAWDSVPEDERKYHLDAAQERLEVRQFREDQTRRQQEAEQQAHQQFREHVQNESQSFVDQQLTEAYTQVLDDLASKVTFSDDPAENAAALAEVGGLLFSLRDPVFRQANEKYLQAAGIKLGSDFDELLTTADTHYRNAKALELMNQKGRAQQELTKANNAKARLFAKISPLAVQQAKRVGGRLAGKAGKTNGLLDDATRQRPTPNGGLQPEGNGGIPYPVNDPRYGIELARRSGLLG